MRFIILFLVMAAELALTSLAPAQTAQVQEVVLENGLKVLLLENHKSPTVTFQVWYRVGSRNEQDGKSGLAHFLEHMMFKGTPQAGPEHYSRVIAKNGGRSNAFTSQDVTVYFATMSREKIGIAIELEADRMTNAFLNGKYFEPEKNVVMEERRLRTEDNPVSALAEVAGAVAYTVHPYRRPVIGWMNDILRLTPEDLQKFYRTYYVPNNAFLVVVGDFASEEILGKIKETFGRIPRGAQPPEVAVEEPPQRGERRANFKKEAELPFLLLYYHVPNLKDPDSFALDLLAVILAGGRSSRLYRDLVYEQRLARGVGADYGGLSVDPTIFSITTQVIPGKEKLQVERSLEAALERVRSEPVSERELQKAKNQVEAGFILGQDSISGQARRIGFYEATADWRLLNSYIEGIRKVTTADIQRAAKKYLDPDRRTVGVLIPLKENG